jgi:hypothetical protein
VLKSGDIDFGFVNLPIEQDDSLEVIKCLDIHDILIGGTNYAGLAENGIALSELSRYPLIMLERASTTRCLIDDFAATNKTELKPIIELGSSDLLVKFARINLGLSFVIREFTEDEVKNYFEHCQKNMHKAVNADDFLQDLCGNLCILLLDGGKFRFVHRSFQEYFCALNIKRTFDKVSADKKAQLSKGLVTFFDGRKISDDKVLEMLYDMAQEKVEEFILVPKLEALLDSDGNGSDDGYWAFLEKAFSNLRCWHEYHEYMETDEDTGEETDESYYDFALDSNGFAASSSEESAIPAASRSVRSEREIPPAYRIRSRAAWSREK